MRGNVVVGNLFGLAEVSSGVIIVQSGLFPKLMGAVVASEVSRRSVLGCISGATALAASRIPVSPAPPTLHVAPTPAGDRSGSGWDNAAGLSALNGLIGRVGPGGRIWVRADAGPYASNAVIILQQGGLSSKPVTIEGVDVNGAAMKAEIVGGRASPWSMGAAYGVEVFRVASGPGHLTFRNFLFRNHGPGCIRVGAPVASITIEDCSAYNVGTFFENLITGSAKEASISGLVIRRCDAHGYSKRMCRIQYDSRDILLEDVHGDSERQDKDNFASGVVFDHTAHGAVLRRCQMDNHIDTRNTYQNGDGFAGERGNYDLTLEDCGARGNTDGGVDFKGDGITIRNFRAEGNHRNYRLWGYADLIDCIGLEPRDNAGPNPYSKANVSCFANALCRVIGGRFTQTGDQAVFLAEAGGVMAISRSTAVDRPSSGVLYSVDRGGGGQPAGVISEFDPGDRTAPVIVSPTQIVVAGSAQTVADVQADRPAQLRIVGGADADMFATNGTQLRWSDQGRQQLAHAPRQMQVQVRMTGLNGVASEDRMLTVSLADNPA